MEETRGKRRERRVQECVFETHAFPSPIPAPDLRSQLLQERHPDQPVPVHGFVEDPSQRRQGVEHADALVAAPGPGDSERGVALLREQRGRRGLTSERKDKRRRR